MTARENAVPHGLPAGAAPTGAGRPVALRPLTRTDHEGATA
jgi:hypothetical protein